MFTLLCKGGKGSVYACLHIANMMSNVTFGIALHSLVEVRSIYI